MGQKLNAKTKVSSQSIFIVQNNNNVEYKWLHVLRSPVNSHHILEECCSEGKHQACLP